MSIPAERMDPEKDFDELHWSIIDVLHEGRATPSYLAERTGESRQLVSHRLRDLRMGNYVEKIHKGLYELAEDPRSHDQPPEPEVSKAPEVQTPPVAEPDVDDDVEVAFREFLQDRPPKKSHAKEIVVDVFNLLREHGEMETGDLQERLFAEYSEHYSTERTLWNAISRYLGDMPGIEKTDDYGGWGYAGDAEVWEAVSNE